MPGLAAADDPGTGESFGQSRMRLVARALIGAWRESKAKPTARFKAVELEFRRYGLSLEASHLNSGNADVYCWPNG